MHVVVVGGGQAGAQVVASLSKKAFVTLIGAEPHLPYQRPPLSKKFLAGELDQNRLFLKPKIFYKDVNVITGAKVTAIKRRAQKVVVGDTAVSGDTTVSYDRLVLALGGTARLLPVPGVSMGGIFTLRTIEDVRAIQGRFYRGARLVVVGGGYIGLEVAAVAATQGLDVVVLEAAPRLLARVAHTSVAQFMHRRHTQAGVRLKTNVQVSAFERAKTQEGTIHVLTKQGQSYEADLVLLGVGLVPNTALAENAGLETKDGILTDERGMTSDASIYAVGDCARFFDPLYKEHVRIESVPGAIFGGRRVAAALLGDEAPPAEAPWFWSDQYDTKLRIAGLPLGCNETVVREGTDGLTVFHLKRGILRAAETVNRPKNFMAARRLIEARTKLSAAQLADETVDLRRFL